MTKEQARIGTVAILLAAPVLLVAGWALLIVNIGRGANDTWAVGHLILFVANAFWLPAVLIVLAGTGRRAADRWSVITLGLVIAGSLTIAGQLAVDLVAWVTTNDAASLSSLFEAMRSRPVLLLLFYVGGPPLLFLGVLLASVTLSRARPEYRPWTEVVIMGLIIVLAGWLTTFSYVILAGYVIALLGFMGISRTMTRWVPLAGSP
jgi:hypothetical protein